MFKTAAITILLTVCMFAQAQTQTNAGTGERVAAGCGDDAGRFTVKKTSEHPTAAPATDKALVYVIDESLERGSLQIGRITRRWGIDGKWVGAENANSYFFFNVDPGEHRLCVDQQSHFDKIARESAAALTFAAEAQKVYFFRLRPRHDTHDKFGDLKLEVVDPAEGQIEISRTKFSTSKPVGK